MNSAINSPSSGLWILSLFYIPDLPLVSGRFCHCSRTWGKSEVLWYSHAQLWARQKKSKCVHLVSWWTLELNLSHEKPIDSFFLIVSFSRISGLDGAPSSPSCPCGHGWASSPAAGCPVLSILLSPCLVIRFTSCFALTSPPCSLSWILSLNWSLQFQCLHTIQCPPVSQGL